MGEAATSENGLYVSYALLHQIQKILHDRVIFAPIWENGFIRASGPRVEEGGLTLIPAFPYSAPAEDMKLKR